MDNQHRKITGYRELSADEIALMNEIKNAGVSMQRLIEMVAGHFDEQAKAAAAADSLEEIFRIRNAQPERWVGIARTHFQEGLMALTRSVAQPRSF